MRFYKESPELLEKWSTCISVLYNAIFKLSFLSKKTTVYRGIDENQFKLPNYFIGSDDSNDLAGGFELAFMSTSTDLPVAIEYAKRGLVSDQCSVFEITVVVQVFNGFRNFLIKMNYYPSLYLSYL